MGLLSPYIKEEWKQTIKAHKYEGTDNSIIYVYLTSPLCNKIVQCIPSYITPNLITCCGLMFNIIINVVIGYYSGLDGSGAIPTWAMVLAAILYPLYHIFDILDGKHARNTDQASSLGLLMDNGCDAMTTFLFTMSLGSILTLEGPFWYALIWLMAAINFYICTWEEYQTDKLNLPIVHGVSEGTFIASAVIIFTVCVGQNFWRTLVPVFGTYYKLSNIFVTCFFLFSMLFTLNCFRNVFKDEKTKNITQALSNNIVFIYLLLTLMIVVFYSNSELIENYPKLIIYMYGFCFAKFVGLLQISHLASSLFYQFNLPTLFFLFTISALSLLQYEIEPVINIDYVIIFFIAFNFLSWLHFAYFVSEEICSFLDINRFTVKKCLKSVEIK